MAEKWANFEREIQERVNEAIRETNTQAKSCAVRASNQLRNSALNVLRGKRSGRIYRKPQSKAKYRASAPGEPPAVRNGHLRHSWGMTAEGDGKGNYAAGIYTDIPYAEPLEKGTGKIEPRPYKDKIVETAKPKIIQIFSKLK